jgi:hypothetical protein
VGTGPRFTREMRIRKSRMGAMCECVQSMQSTQSMAGMARGAAWMRPITPRQTCHAPRAAFAVGEIAHFFRGIVFHGWIEYHGRHGSMGTGGANGHDRRDDPMSRAGQQLSKSGSNALQTRNSLLCRCHPLANCGEPGAPQIQGKYVNPTNDGAI